MLGFSAPEGAALIASLLAVLGVIWTSLSLRKNNKENAENVRDANDTARFDALLKAQDLRIKAQGEQIASLEAKVQVCDGSITQLQSQLLSTEGLIKQMKKIVRAWFHEIESAWALVSSHPMPMPTPEDLALLEITPKPHTTTTTVTTT